jgi:hypothetical protein
MLPGSPAAGKSIPTAIVSREVDQRFLKFIRRGDECWQASPADGFFAHGQTSALSEASARGSAPVRREPPVQGKLLKLTPDELVMLAPRPKTCPRRPDPSWPELVDTTASLRSGLDVTKSLWREASIAIGREKAAFAIAIVSTIRRFGSRFAICACGRECPL